MPTAIRHEPDRSRFVADLGEDAQAVLDYRVPAPGLRDYYRTYVPPALRGQGLATELAEFALEDARAAGARVIATCPFVARVAASPRFADILER